MSNVSFNLYGDNGEAYAEEESMQSPACYFLILLQMGVCAAEQ